MLILKLERFIQQTKIMDDYLVDREALEQFVDELFKQKPLPANSAEELNTLREDSIRQLDDAIGMAVFGRLSEAQLAELNQKLDSGEDTPEYYQSLFDTAGIDLKQTITSAMEQFRNNFLEVANV